MKRFRFTTLLAIVVLGLGIAYAVCPPYLRKAIIYQKADIDDYKIFDNRIVATDHPQPWSFAPGFDKKDVPEIFNKEFDKYKTVAFLVVKNAKIVFEKYWDDYSADSKSNSFSMAKSIISLLVGIALDEGLIYSVDQPVGDYLPEFKEGGKSKITIRHLLEMSSGLSWDESYSKPSSMTAKGYYGDDVRSLVLNQEVLQDPGTRFEFKSGDTQLLALILEKATRSRVSYYASEKLWKPMGAAHDAWWSLDRINGTEKAFCCFHTNARDFARFGQLVLLNGNWYGKQLVSRDYLKQALKPSTHLTDGTGKKVDYFGWQWWLMTYKGKQVIYMSGLNGQYVIVIPETETVIVRLGHKCSSEKLNGAPVDFFTWLDTGIQLAEIEVE